MRGEKKAVKLAERLRCGAKRGTLRRVIRKIFGICCENNNCTGAEGRKDINQGLDTLSESRNEGLDA